jgi:UDP-N-acetylglucosamine--N-acetylmuramyl-(pentapeptide) pyrophosphoryl-undecaprenol N-acetylglucosamine transferase
LKLVIGAGGTGGHIIPSLAIGLELLSRDWKITFIGNRDGMEETLAQAYNFDFLPIRAQKIYRKLTLQHLRFPVLLTGSLIKSIRYLRKLNPDAVLCTGGFVSGPVALASIILKKRLYFQDGNSYPGLTTRCLAGYARHVFTASYMAKRYLKSADCLLTGNPIMKYSLLEKDGIDWTKLNLSRESKKLFVIGGSQGSAIINKAVSECVERLLEMNIELIWQTGKAHLADIKLRYGSLHGVHCFDFSTQMSDYYQMADMAISRAGALSIAELEEHCLPAIFIPLPTAAENHQYKNAVSQIEKGVGVLLEQNALTPDVLLNAIAELSDNYELYKARLSSLPPNHATQAISDIIERESRSQ